VRIWDPAAREKQIENRRLEIFSFVYCVNNPFFLLAAAMSWQGKTKTDGYFNTSKLNVKRRDV